MGDAGYLVSTSYYYRGWFNIIAYGARYTPGELSEKSLIEG